MGFRNNPTLTVTDMALAREIAERVGVVLREVLAEDRVARAALSGTICALCGTVSCPGSCT